LKKRTDKEKGPFFGRFGRKTGVGRAEKTLFFAFFHFFVFYCVCKLLAGKIFRRMRGSKKNRAKKPTVGFLFLRACGNLVA
jgi:hypothetical protein